MIDDFERCPNCHKSMVYTRHHNDKWHIFCWACGLKTREHDTHSKAREEWDKIARTLQDIKRGEEMNDMEEKRWRD